MRTHNLCNSRAGAWFAGLLMLVSSMPAAAAEFSDPEEWQYGAEVYFWGASIGGTSATGGNIDIGIDTLLDDLDMAFMGAFGARKGKWTLAADLIYLDVSAQNSSVLTLPVGPGVNITGSADVKLKGWIVTPTVRYNVIQNEKGSLDLLAGARYLWLDAEIRVAALGRQAMVADSGSVLDAVIGVSGQIELADKWYLPLYLDVGAGESDLTWQAFAGVGYRTKKMDLLLGYRYIDWDFDNSPVFNDLNMGGAFIGTKFWF